MLRKRSFEASKKASETLEQTKSAGTLFGGVPALFGIMIQLPNAARIDVAASTPVPLIHRAWTGRKESSERGPHRKFFYAAKEGLKSPQSAFFHVRSGVRRKNIRAIRLFMCASVGSGAFRL